jgi:hypothetical protein
MIKFIASKGGKIGRDFLYSGVHALFRTWRCAAVVFTKRTGRRIIMLGLGPRRFKFPKIWALTLGVRVKSCDFLLVELVSTPLEHTNLVGSGRTQLGES